MAAGIDDPDDGVAGNQADDTAAVPPGGAANTAADTATGSGESNQGNEPGTLDLDALAGAPTDQAPPPAPPPATAGSVPFTDQARRTIALFLLWLLAAIVLASFGLLLWALADASNVTNAHDNFATISNWLSIVFGPVSTLVGSAVGFYFGAQNSRAAGSGNNNSDET